MQEIVVTRMLLCPQQQNTNTFLLRDFVAAVFDTRAVLVSVIFAKEVNVQILL
jgi:hypothetical protein